MHPSYVEGQYQGGAAQGIGWALNEEYIYGKDGRLQNAGFLDYRIPVCSDLPMIDTQILKSPIRITPKVCAAWRNLNRAAARCHRQNAISNGQGRRTHDPRAHVAPTRAEGHQGKEDVRLDRLNERRGKQASFPRLFYCGMVVQ